MREYKHKIAAIVERWQTEGRKLNADWITNELHESIGNAYSTSVEDEDSVAEAKYYTREGLRQHVSQFIRRILGNDREDDDYLRRQGTFPGMEHVQRYYNVPRGDAEIFVPTQELTDAEIDFCSERLRAHGETCIAHADELQRYKLERRRKGRG